MSKLHIKKDDTVIVIAGADKGKTGKVLKVLVEENRAIVEGVHMVSKSTKPSAKNPQVLKKRLSYLLHEAHEQQDRRYGYHEAHLHC